jgi:hypothetical protein
MDRYRLLGKEFQFCKMKRLVGHQRLMLVILATWQGEIKAIMVQGQPKQVLGENPHLQNNQRKMD